MAGTGGLALLAMLESCSHHTAKGSAKEPFEQALQLLRDAVRSSPDHLSRRADDAVAAKDATRIAAFVRDHVAVVPPWSEGDDVAVARRWGSAATLRGGQGTLRDRADLLAGLLTKAGFPASVKIATRPAAINLTTLYQDRLVALSPDQHGIDRAQGLLATAGVPVPSSKPALPPEAPDPVPAIVGALPGAVQQITPRTDLLPDQVPVVAFTEHGTTKYAFALGNLAPAAAPEGLADADPASPLPTVKVTVSGLANPAPGSRTPRGELIDLVHGEWATDALVGRQLLLTFVPPEGPKALLTTKSAADLPVRVPVLRLQAESPATAPPGKVGPIISVQGDVYSGGSSGGQLDGPYGPIKVATADERKKAIAAAATVAVSANASTFPEVALDVAVRDANGASVDGLDATAFTVTDSAGKPSAVTIRSNAKDTTRPRVLIAYDTSGSVSDSWPSAQAQSTFEQSLASTLQGAATQTPFDVQVVGLGQDPDKDAWKAPTSADVVAALHSVSSDSSVWETVGGPALDQGPVAIVLVSDNQSALEDPAAIPTFQRRLASAGVPVFCLPVGQPDEKATSTILSLSHGARLDPNGESVATKLADLIKPLAAKRTAAGYRLSYVAPAGGPAQRTVTVALAGRAALNAPAKYEVPAKPVTPASFVGLYVTFEVNGQTVRRRLAGLHVTGTGVPIGALDDAAAGADTRAAIYGVTTIAFEPGLTTQAAMLDDVLSSYLSIEPLRPIWKKATPDEILKKAGNTIRRVPGLFTSLLAPLPAIPGAVSTFRVAILQERQLGNGTVQRHIDLPPDLNEVVALGPDPKVAFQAAVRASATASIAEAATLDDSAFSRLIGKKLTPIVNGDGTVSAAFLASVPVAQKSAWGTVLDAYQDKNVLVPVGGAANALWVIDPGTGATTAVLLDGTGGALAVCPSLNGWDWANLVAGVIGVGCTLGAIVAPFLCAGVTAASIAFTAFSVLQSGWTPGASFGTAGGVFGASLPPKYAPPTPRLGGRIGVAGLVITLTLISLECAE